MSSGGKLSFISDSSVFPEVGGARKAWKCWWVGDGLVLEESGNIESLD